MVGGRAPRPPDRSSTRCSFFPVRSSSLLSRALAGAAGSRRFLFFSHLRADQPDLEQNPPVLDALLYRLQLGVGKLLGAVSDVEQDPFQLFEHDRDGRVAGPRRALTIDSPGRYQLLGALSIAASAIFSGFGRGGGFPGESPFSVAFCALVRAPAFWLMVVLFGLGVSSTIGVYAMLPLYLVAERHVEPSWANTLVALSRSYGPILGLLGGWASDKLGAKQTIVISLVFTGAATSLLGPLSEHWLSGAVLFQPLLAVWFFPAAFAAIAMITPPNARNLAVAFSVPFGFLIGGGAIPTFIGAMGDAGSFATGFMLTGALIASGGVLALLLKLPAASDGEK